MLLFFQVSFIHSMRHIYGIAKAVPEDAKSIRPCYISSYGFEEVPVGMPFWQIGMKNNGVSGLGWYCVGFALGPLAREQVSR